MSDIPVRQYKMTDSSLYMWISTLCMWLRQDIDVVGAYNITEEKILALLALRPQFIDVKTDNQMKGRLKQAVQERKKQRKEILQRVGLLRVRAEICFAAAQPLLEEFTFRRIPRAKDTELASLVSGVAQTAEKYLATLAERGVTQAEIDELQQKAADFTLALQAVTTARTNRMIARNERIAICNEMYALGSEYAKIAQAAFANTDAVRYANYVIYPHQKKRSRKTTPPIAGQNE